MRELNTQELNVITGAGKAATAPNPLALITGLLASKGITLSFDKVAHSLTITTPKGSKTFTLPSHSMPTAPAAPAEEATE